MNRPPSGTLMDPLIHLIAAKSSFRAAKSSFRGAGQVPGLLRCGAAKLAQPKTGGVRRPGLARPAVYSGVPSTPRDRTAQSRPARPLRFPFPASRIAPDGLGGPERISFWGREP